MSGAESALKYRDKQRAKTKLKGEQTAFYVGAVEIIWIDIVVLCQSSKSANITLSI